MNVSSSPGKALRLSQFINPGTGRSLIVEADLGSMLGPVGGFLDIAEAVESIRTEVDSVILNPGQAARLSNSFKGREAPCLLIRVDWTNLFRGEGSILPAREVRHVMSANAYDAVTLGASGVAAYLFMGYENDEDEAGNVEALAKLARECDRYGMPMLVEAMPIGNRVTALNYVDCLDLAMRVSVELGADAVAVPYPGSPEGLRRIIEASKVPVFILDLKLKTQGLLSLSEDVLRTGASGFIVGKEPFEAADLKALRSIVHRET